MAAIEKENPSLRGVLPRDYARPTLDQNTLGELIDLVATIGLGDAESRSKDVRGSARIGYGIRGAGLRSAERILKRLEAWEGPEQQAGGGHAMVGVTWKTAS